MKTGFPLRPKLLVLLTLLAVVSAACGGGSDPTDIGIRRVALSLSFAEEALAEPVPPNVVVQFLPPTPGLTADNLAAFRNPEPLPFVNPFACPVAPKGSSAKVPVAFATKVPPAAGRYLRHNTGKITLEGGVFPISVPYPAVSRDDVSPPRQVEVQTVPGTPPTKVVEFDVKRVLLEVIERIDTYRITATAIELVRRRTVIPPAGIDQTFEPTPPIDVYVFGVENSSWNDAGVDEVSGQAMGFQGRIERREVVDVCGQLVDTYRVSAQETIINLRTGETNGTRADRPNIYNVAPQFGGLFVREDVKTTETVREPQSGALLLLRWEFVTTINDTKPLR